LISACFAALSFSTFCSIEAQLSSLEQVKNKHKTLQSSYVDLIRALFLRDFGLPGNAIFFLRHLLLQICDWNRGTTKVSKLHRAFVPCKQGWEFTLAEKGREGRSLLFVVAGGFVRKGSAAAQSGSGQQIHAPLQITLAHIALLFTRMIARPLSCFIERTPVLTLTGRHEDACWG
jgi:hypothetical protein